AGQDAGQASEQLAARLAELEERRGDLGRRIEETAAAMTATIDAALLRAADGLETTRQGIAEHHSSMVAMLEQGQAAVADAGQTSSAAFSRRIDHLVLQIQSLEAKL